MMLQTREVWKMNVCEELVLLKDCVKNFPLIALDTEFPGFIRHTPRHAPEDECYRDMKFNVEGTKLIQLGITLFNVRGEIGGTWEFNFSNFGDPSDARNEASMVFLARHGLDLEKIKEDGIDMFRFGFFPRLFAMMSCQRDVQWVTFHGNYDLAYAISDVFGRLPATSDEFADAVGRVFGVVHDLKVIACSTGWLGDHLGLESMAHKLQVRRIGLAHHAGSDSLLTAFMFIAINRLRISTRDSVGYLYGIRRRVTPARATEDPRHSGILYNSRMFYNNYPIYWNPRTIYNGASAANPWCYNALPPYVSHALPAYMSHAPNAPPY